MAHYQKTMLHLSAGCLILKYKNICEKIFSLKNENNHKIITLSGIKIKFKYIPKKHYKITKKSIKLQNKYDLTALKTAKRLIVFLIPEHLKINGGIMSIFSLCECTREVDNGLCLISTVPSEFTYCHNSFFENNEKIYRLEQIIKNAESVKELIIHIPEYFVSKFYGSLKQNEIDFLKSIQKLRINILNQNIDLMPDAADIKDLYNLTDNISQTTGFKSYTNQEVCNQYGVDLYYLPPFTDLEKCIQKDFSQKQNIILYSNDKNVSKDRIINKLQFELSDFKLLEINNLSYSEFLDSIATAKFCISFGEGFDGYYIQPYYAKSIGICVYNETFFPDEYLKNFTFVYKDYDDMCERIVKDIQNIFDNKEKYELISNKAYTYLKDNINSKERTKNGLKSFYAGNPMFLKLI